MRLSAVLADIRAFLVSHPGEVLVIVVEDGAAPQDFVAQVRSAGLEDFVYRGPITSPWPTLRTMIAGGQRLVLLAERHGGGAPWLRPAFAAIQETPYTFKSAAALTDPARLSASCVPNRGEPGASLLQINHWVDTSPAPRPSNADRVNAHAALLQRVRACEAQRGRRANVVAVDFYRHGDLFGVVDELNGVSGPR